MINTKRFNTMTNIGRAKYVVNYHDGLKKHNDGSDFFDIAIFKNKNKLNTFINELYRDGYIEAKMDIYQDESHSGSPIHIVTEEDQNINYQIKYYFHVTEQED